MDEREHLRALVAHLAGELARAWEAVTPQGRARWERQRKPVPGDLVVEESTHWLSPSHRVWSAEHGPSDRFGRLIAEVRERIPDDDPTEPPRFERVHYIALSDGRVHRWVNAGFAAVPESPGAFEGGSER